MSINLVVLLAVLLPILAGAGTFFYVRKRRNQSPPTEAPATPANGKQTIKSNPGHLLFLGVDKRAATLFYGDLTNMLVFEIMVRADISTAKPIKGALQDTYPEAILFPDAFQGKEKYRYYGIKKMQEDAREYLLSLPVPEKTAFAPPEGQKTG